jgi:hypothetical protein
LVGAVAAFAFVAAITAMSFAGALVVKNAGVCTMVGSDADGNPIIGGTGILTTLVINNNQIHVDCKGTGIANDSRNGQHFSGFACALDFLLTFDSQATVSANGNAELHCNFR